MAQSLFSPSWYRVSKLTPRLRSHTSVYAHDYRGETWYVLQDDTRGSYYRFSPATYQVIGRMDGKRTVQELWDSASERLGDDGPTQQEIVQLLSRLHSADILLCDVPPDTAELLKRSAKLRRTEWLQKLRTPLAVKFPLWDPETFLTRTIGLVRPLFGVAGAVVWLSVVVTALVLLGQHWSEVTENVIDRVLSAQNLVVLWFVYPLVKAAHELGHGYAVKSWGGEVHEMGIMLLVFMPVPYVDASAASQYRATHRRAIVGAAGIMVELFLAALALLLWLELEPGPLRSMAYNVMLIGGVSTLLFNGNPLLRFDGYYVLADLLQIPNLAQRGKGYMGWLVRHYIFRAKQEPAPQIGPGERFWFVVYTISAIIYRLFIYVSIVLFIAGRFFFIGVLLAMWAAFSMVVVPIFKGVKFIVSSPTLREQRGRAVLLTLVGLTLLGLLLFVAPFPLRTRSEGVVWIPEDSMVRAGSSGFVSRVVAVPNERVARGDLLIECDDPLLVANLEVLRARLDELQSRYDAALTLDKAQAQILEEEISHASAQLARAEERFAELEIRSPDDGLFVLPGAQDLPDRYLRQGELVAYVVDVGRPTVRVVVPQARVDLVRQRTRGIEARLIEQIGRTVPAELVREVPGARGQLPSTTLGSAGGGEIAVDPFDPSRTKTLGTLFQFDIELVEPLEAVFVGGRVYVRFDHGFEPLGFQIYRKVRQVFLRRFNV